MILRSKVNLRGNAGRKRGNVAINSQSAESPTIYGNSGSRTPLVWWYLNEIGQPYEVGDAGNPHPFGQVPALKEGELEIFESGAILMYLADKYGGLDTAAKRADANKWITWANATLDPAIFSPNIQASAPRVLDKLDGLLASIDTYLVEDEFSVADVAVGSYLLYIPVFFPRFSVAKWKNVTKYMKLLSSRGTFTETFGPQHAARVEQFLG
ncbi:glutathione S-transferase [Cymbomonas tetramitiformis]|uniref:Glutathione S-transferase n=1 Tax=Cymbomonas tetramitiformis TaxID=36881 RepID=A0AAE0BPV9_9CHLO|nr:glutathione S-transferase [Cymbomonas tetramitiformis]